MLISIIMIIIITHTDCSREGGGGFSSPLVCVSVCFSTQNLKNQCCDVTLHCVDHNTATQLVCSLVLSRLKRYVTKTDLNTWDCGLWRSKKIIPTYWKSSECSKDGLTHHSTTSSLLTHLLTREVTVPRL